jgi:hypothetical protein
LGAFFAIKISYASIEQRNVTLGVRMQSVICRLIELQRQKTYVEYTIFNHIRDEAGSTAIPRAFLLAAAATFQK